MRKCYVLQTTHASGESWVTGVYSSRKKANEALKFFGEKVKDVKREIITAILE